MKFKEKYEINKSLILEKFCEKGNLLMNRIH